MTKIQGSCSFLLVISVSNTENSIKNNKDFFNYKSLKVDMIDSKDLFETLMICHFNR